MATITVSPRAALINDAGPQAALDNAWQFIGPFLPGLDIVNHDIDVRAGMPAFTHPRSRPARGHLVKAASALPGVITIAPQRYNLSTASGIALLAHELVHQEQFQNDPGSLDAYDAEERRVKAAGLPPWANRFEKPAYETEARVYYAALDAGYPPGDHVPLLVSEGMAELGPGEQPNLGFDLFFITVSLVGLSLSILATTQRARQLGA